MGDHEPLRGDEALHQFTTGLAILLVIDAEWHAPYVKADAIAEQSHLHHRHEQGDGEAARVAPHLQRLLERDGEEAPRIHALASAARGRETR